MKSINVLATVLNFMHVKVFRYWRLVGLIKNVIFSGSNMISLVHIDSKKKDALEKVSQMV